MHREHHQWQPQPLWQQGPLMAGAGSPEGMITGIVLAKTREYREVPKPGRTETFSIKFSSIRDNRGKTN